MPERRRYKAKPILAPVPIVREVIELIQASSWKDWQVAEIAGVSRPYISQLRNGKRTDVSVVCLDKLLKVFGRRLVIGSIKNGRAGAPGHRRKPAHGHGVKTKPERPKIPYAGKDD